MSFPGSLQVGLRSVASQVVYTDVAQPQSLGGAVKLTSVEVAGNVDVVLINGVDLRQLDANTVKVTGDFALQGEARHARRAVAVLQNIATLSCVSRLQHHLA